MIKYYIKFYADTSNGDKNKLFTFEINPLYIGDFFQRMQRQGFYIRAAWQVKKVNGKEVENIRLKHLHIYYN